MFAFAAGLLGSYYLSIETPKFNSESKITTGNFVDIIEELNNDIIRNVKKENERIKKEYFEPVLQSIREKKGESAKYFWEILSRCEDNCESELSYFESLSPKFVWLENNFGFNHVPKLFELIVSLKGLVSNYSDNNCADYFIKQAFETDDKYAVICSIDQFKPEMKKLVEGMVGRSRNLSDLAERYLKAYKPKSSINERDYNDIVASGRSYLSIKHPTEDNCRVS